MAKLNRSQFAELVDVNEGVIRRAIKRGRIIVGDDNLIDSDTQVARWHATRDESKVRGEVTRGRGRPVTATDAEANAEGLDGQQLKAEKTALEIELLKEELAQVRRDTISRDDVRRGLAAFARLQRDKWINFPNRFGAQIAADIGADPKAVMASLDKFVREQLTEIANIKSTVT